MDKYARGSLLLANVLFSKDRPPPYVISSESCHRVQLRHSLKSHVAQTMLQCFIEAATTRWNCSSDLRTRTIVLNPLSKLDTGPHERMYFWQFFRLSSRTMSLCGERKRVVNMFVGLCENWMWTDDKNFEYPAAVNLISVEVLRLCR